MWKVKIQEKDRQICNKSSLRWFSLSSSLSPSPVSTPPRHLSLTQRSPKLSDYIYVPIQHFLGGTWPPCLLILTRSCWQPRRANKMHRRRTERRRNHKREDLKFEIRSSESSSLQILTQEPPLCCITTSQSDDRQNKRYSVHTHLLCWLVSRTG